MGNQGFLDGAKLDFVLPHVVLVDFKGTPPTKKERTMEAVILGETESEPFLGVDDSWRRSHQSKRGENGWYATEQKRSSENPPVGAPLKASATTCRSTGLLISPTCNFNIYLKLPKQKVTLNLYLLKPLAKISTHCQ